jgi:hypothetical protein
VNFWVSNYWATDFWVANYWVGNNITAAPSGTIPGSDQSLIHDTGGTLILTLTNDTWIAAGTGPIGTTAQSNAIVASITSAQVEAAGWNVQVRDALDNTDLTRDSDTQATLTVPVTAGYVITADETITATIPNAVLTTSGLDIVASTFDVNQFAGGGKDLKKKIICQDT